jgi:hypothetical protein
MYDIRLQNSEERTTLKGKLKDECFELQMFTIIFSDEL